MDCKYTVEELTADLSNLVHIILKDNLFTSV